MPTTPNVVLEVPNTGDLQDTWGSAATNPNFSAIDGLLGGVVSIALTNAPVTLTAPAGTPAPAAGPFQSQNAIIQLTGTLTADVTITLPLPGRQTIANFTTTASTFVVNLRAVGVGEVVSLPDGVVIDVFNDGTNVKFINGFSTYPSKLEFYAGLSAVPTWISGCTVKPYLVADGTVYNIVTYPSLAKRLGSAFGGNGLTTFGVPDLRGRVPLMVNGGTGRITSAVSGIDGNTLGSSGGNQGIAITQAQLPSANLTTSIAAGQGLHAHGIDTVSNAASGGSERTVAGTQTSSDVAGLAATLPAMTGTTPLGGSNAQHANVQPGQVTGIWLVKT